MSGYYIGKWAVQGGQRYVIENVRQGLDEPGEWYWDSAAAEVQLLPPASHQPGTELFAVAPRLSQLIELESVSHFSLFDVELRHTVLGERVDEYYVGDAAIVATNVTDILL